MKIQITKKQAQDFNKMLAALKQISKEFETPSQLRKSAENRYGLDFEEAIEMAYENIQEVAKRGAKGVRLIAEE